MKGEMNEQDPTSIGHEQGRLFQLAWSDTVAPSRFLIHRTSRAPDHGISKKARTRRTFRRAPARRPRSVNAMNAAASERRQPAPPSPGVKLGANPVSRGLGVDHPSNMPS